MLIQIQAIIEVGNAATQQIFPVGSFEAADTLFDKMMTWGNQALVMFVEHADGSELVLRRWAA